MQDTSCTTVTISVNGIPLTVPHGISVAAAVAGHGLRAHTRRHPVDGSARGPCCLMGVCFECVMEIDGVTDAQGCLVTVREGMEVLLPQDHVEEA